MIKEFSGRYTSMTIKDPKNPIGEEDNARAVELLRAALLSNEPDLKEYYVMLSVLEFNKNINKRLETNPNLNIPNTIDKMFSLPRTDHKPGFVDNPRYNKDEIETLKTSFKNYHAIYDSKELAIELNRIKNNLQTFLTTRAIEKYPVWAKVLGVIFVLPALFYVALKGIEPLKAMSNSKQILELNKNIANVSKQKEEGISPTAATDTFEQIEEDWKTTLDEEEISPIIATASEIKAKTENVQENLASDDEVSYNKELYQAQRANRLEELRKFVPLQRMAVSFDRDKIRENLTSENNKQEETYKKYFDRFFTLYGNKIIKPNEQDLKDLGLSSDSEAAKNLRIIKAPTIEEVNLIALALENVVRPSQTKLDFTLIDKPNKINKNKLTIGSDIYIQSEKGKIKYNPKKSTEFHISEKMSKIRQAQDKYKTFKHLSTSTSEPSKLDDNPPKKSGRKKRNINNDIIGVKKWHSNQMLERPLNSTET